MYIYMYSIIALCQAPLLPRPHYKFNNVTCILIIYIFRNAFQKTIRLLFEKTTTKQAKANDVFMYSNLRKR